ncbi:MarR family transcriptional regulator [Brachybacterium paraconglomeratum]|uniref:MarR family transcriptional regulator n=1 Tax=Brachybacterium paraconglomeratum TaxID=173362 RepID=UPI003513F5EC
MSATTAFGSDALPAEVYTDDALAYARTIHHGVAPRERRALAAVLDNMPCTISEVPRAAGMSRRTAQRACEALEDRGAALLLRTGAGLIIAPDVIGAVEAWADEHGPRSHATNWWEDPVAARTHEVAGHPQDEDRELWPDGVFPIEPPEAEDVGLALQAVEGRRVPVGRGVRIPFAVLDYVAATRSLQAAKVALECGRRASRTGVAEFGRGELSRNTGLSSQQVSDTLARLRRDGIATSATTTRVELNLEHR